MNPLLQGAKKVEWTSKEAQDFRDFLNSDTGVKMLTLAHQQTPNLLDGSDVNKTLVASGMVKGWTALIDAMASWTVADPNETTGTGSIEYPSLDDESQWPDADKK